MDRTGNEDNRRTGRRRTTSGDRHLDLVTITAYLDGTLDRDERDAVEAHLAGCAACRQETAEIGATVGLLQELPRYRPNRSFRLDPAVARQERGNVVWLGRYLSALPVLRAATAAVALLFLGTIVADVLTEPDAPAEPNFAAEQEAAPTARNRVLATVTATAPPDAARSGLAPNDTQAMEAAGDAANDEAPAAAPGGDQQRAAVAQAPTATATPLPTATPVPTATPPPTPTPVPERPASGLTNDVPWRLAQIALGAVLVLLVVALIALQRLRRRLRGRS